MNTKVIFLDRDGVINQDSPHYIKSWSEFHFLPKSLDALKLLKQHGMLVIVITNQSAVNRNIITSKTLTDIHSKMCHEINAHGGNIEDIFYCPHRPDQNCDCRKPKPGLILRAQKKYNIELPSAIMVGDKLSDIQCAYRAGCPNAVLIRSRKASIKSRDISVEQQKPSFTTTTLYAAVEWILGLNQTSATGN